MMIRVETVRRWVTRAVVVAVLLTAYSNLTGCTEKVYDQDHGHRDHDFHDHDHDHDHDDGYRR